MTNKFCFWLGDIGCGSFAAVECAGCLLDASYFRGHPPVACQPGDLVSGAWYTGPYCDNNYPLRADINLPIFSHSWSLYVSEEGMNYRFCLGNSFITGQACQGSYCDNTSVECTDTGGIRNSCYWTSFFSEEQDGIILLSGYYAARIQCPAHFVTISAFMRAKTN
jgi:hypothetical protein